ncbi:MAG: aspartate/glutamate racemase family protein [Dehalococcoidia bacterium]
MALKDIKRILYLNPDATDKLNKIHQGYLDRYISAGYEIEVRNIEYGGELPACAYYTAISVPYIVDEILKGETEGFDATIVACFGNPGVKEAREVVRTPVIALGESACYIAALLGDTIGIVTAGAKIQHQDLRLNDNYHNGLANRVVSIRCVDVSSAGGIETISERDLSEETELLIQQGKKAIEEDGADVLILGCAGMIGVAEAIQNELGVPVVDATLVSLKIAEMFISLGLTHSTLAYPFKNIRADECPIIYPSGLKGYHGYRS